MDIAAWLAQASADADARGLPDLKPLLETLARSTQALRDGDEAFRHPAAEHSEHMEHPEPAKRDDHDAG